MATVLSRTEGLAAPYRKLLIRSANTPDFDPGAWIINPDLSAVEGVPDRYWTISGDTVTAVDQATRDARDAEVAALRIASERAEARDSFDAQIVLRAVTELLIDEVNRLRAQFNSTTGEVSQLTTTRFSQITPKQARQAIRAKIAELS